MQCRERLERKNPFELAVVVICSPCICLLSCVTFAVAGCVEVFNFETPGRKKRRERRERNAENAFRVPSNVLGPRLERHLTIGREIALDHDLPITIETKGSDVESIGRTEFQSQSRLFSLPPEIRRQIYDYVLGGYVFHISSTRHIYRNQSYLARCRPNGSEICRGTACRSTYSENGWFEARLGGGGLLALLKTCRLIYSESIEMLYQRNTFDFLSMNDVVRFAVAILPERMQLIKKVQWRAVRNHPTIYIDKTPWLQCKAPATCSCIACWPDNVYTDINSHDWVAYTWLVRVSEDNPAVIQWGF